MSLVKVYNKAIKRPAFAYNPSAKPGFSPSSLGEKCVRKVYYAYNKSPSETDFPLKAQRIMKLGDLVGDHFSDIYRKAGILIDYYDASGKTPVIFKKPCKEFPIRAPKLGINWGFIDAVVIENGKLFLGEYKSINERGFIALTEPKPEHLVQGVTYFHVFNHMLRNGDFKHIKELVGFERAENITFVYYGKNVSELKEFVISDTSSVFKKTLERISYVMGIGEGDELPEMTENFCADCSYAKRCTAEQLAPRHGGLLDIA